METAPPDICENDKVFTCAMVTVDIGVSYTKGKLLKGCIFHYSCLEVVKLKWKLCPILTLCPLYDGPMEGSEEVILLGIKIPQPCMYVKSS